jgi:dienelactone hydrolase
MSDAFDAVELDSRNPFVLKDLLRPNVPRIVTTGRLYLPPPSVGPGPFPGMVLVHGLGGMKANRELRYGEWLASLGVVALLVDSYTCRGIATRPDGLRALAVTESMFLADAFAALNYLSRHADVDRARIGVMGFSYGGMVSVLSSFRQIQEICAREDEAFAGHISFYGCSVARLQRIDTTGAPVLIMNGALDRNVSTERWNRIAADPGPADRMSISTRWPTLITNGTATT